MLNLDIAIIPHGQLSNVIHGLFKYLKKSEAWTRGRATVDDIVGFLYSGKMFLWLVYEVGTTNGYGFIIAEVKEYPRCKMLVLQYCAGEPNHMKIVEDKMYETMDRFAKDAGCAGIEFFGRPGWAPHVKGRGYKVKTVLFEKYFEKVQS